jgi:ribosomal protein S18 acetylase RimI-like enzyme
MAMVITVPANRQARHGPRPINLNRDIPQVLDLLKVAFGEALDAEGQRALQGYATPGAPPAFFWRFNPAASRLSQGYVWEENGRLVGNVTLLKTGINGRFLIVNVAVHPDYRRRGIARNLMNVVGDHVRQHGGRQILLQVDHDNTSAIDLYHSLQYQTLGDMTSWLGTAGRIHKLENQDDQPVRDLRGREWQEAYALDCRALAPDLNWPEPIPANIYQQGIWRSLNNFLNGRSSETWVTTQEGQLTGLASIWSEWARAHHLTLRVLPEWAGWVERPLLAKTIRRLAYLSNRNVRVDHPSNDLVTGELLRQANFKAKRTLTHMRLDLA